MSAAAEREGADPAMLEALRRFESAVAVGRLTAALVHQMRTPLHVIQSSAELLRQGGSSQPLDMIERSTQRLVAITDALRAYAQPESAAPAPGDLAAVLERACSLAEAACKKQGVKLRKEISGGPAVALDADPLLGAFYDLLANAVEAMPQGGTLTVAAAPRDGGVDVRIADTGPGMEPAVLARAGQPFFSTKGSAGLGLYLARAAFKRHGAVLALDSAPGTGTRLTIRFPGAERNHGRGSS